ncbi:MAG TPA: cytochrome c [Pararhizobium sp.]|uniref:c-type cytochrome n=1 Tax=Pararhizobium sp. TaxID=1977563 RepID=UPI002B7741B7|nr:cytochrome c [Pararhizobium sp.]HTO31049.1 cytochrome c [Pararhizobium sp.]
MKLKTILSAMVIAGCGAGAVLAADDPVKVREGLMKGIGRSMGAIAGIAKGEKPYDAEVVKTALTTISTNIKAFPDQFPAGSDVNSEASPKIWENMDDFKAHAAKLGTDADTLLAQLPADQAGVGAAAGMLGKDCGACHELYRIKK